MSLVVCVLCPLDSSLISYPLQQEIWTNKQEAKESKTWWGRTAENPWSVSLTSSSSSSSFSFSHSLSSPQASSAMFFQFNTQLGPPYHVLVDTNFINFSIRNKLDMVQSMMDCLYAKCTYISDMCIFLINLFFLGIPYITDCVMAEIEKLGRRYRVALRWASCVLISHSDFSMQNCERRTISTPSLPAQGYVRWWLLSSEGHPSKFIQRAFKLCISFIRSTNVTSWQLVTKIYVAEFARFLEFRSCFYLSTST